MSKKSGVIIISIVAIVLIIYLIIIFETYKKGSFIFKDGTFAVPANACHPLISVKKMSPDEKAAANAAHTASLK